MILMVCDDSDTNKPNTNKVIYYVYTSDIQLNNCDTKNDGRTNLPKYYCTDITVVSYEYYSRTQMFTHGSEYGDTTGEKDIDF